MLAVTARHQRIRGFMIQALGRNAGDRFSTWKRFTSVSKKVEKMEPHRHAPRLDWQNGQ